ncbi:ankyrin repeat domain-containing protein [Luteimonas aquatica]|uniref:ankyrin repeat domain-containing protein n=1 Tax=Luteimonas aquatica TaxID=450364 RepID=UPI001F56D185|nr:ankyrin repeat domain-containing protein [Luteimonas aquatica]
MTAHHFQAFALALLLGTLTACSAQPSAPPAPGGWNAAHDFDEPAQRLIRAVEKRKTDEIQRLVRQEGIDPDRTFTANGMPLVAWPVLARDPEGLRLLLEAGADPNARQYAADGRPRNNAMVLAAREEDPRYLRMLLDHGGDPNTLSTNYEPLTYAAFLQNRWQNVQLLVQRGAHIDRSLSRDMSGTNSDVNLGFDSLMSWYSSLGDFDKVYWLLQQGGNPALRLNKPPGKQWDADRGRMPILESIFWLPVQPRMGQWQVKCQQFVLDKGLKRPPMPQFLRERRADFGLPVDEKAVPVPSAQTVPSPAPSR